MLTNPIRPRWNHNRLEAIGGDFNYNQPLSGYLAGKRRGGKLVQRFEDAWAERFWVKHAIACNSATSGLWVASNACGPEWNELSIAVPCFTMSATAAAPKIARPHNELFFMDCDYHTYCSTPDHCPKAHIGLIIVTDLFGQAADLTGWRKFANDIGALLIEDASQSPFATTPDNKLAGTIGDVGVFSFNVHKHLNVGEGGMIVTNDDFLAEQMRGYMNHGECLGHEFPGLNLRMTEVTAAMAYEQLLQADDIIKSRRQIAAELTDMTKNFWSHPIEYGKHVFYHWAVRVPNRDAVIDFLNKEGIPMRAGYVEPLYHLPAFYQGDDHVPCAVAEKAHKELMIFEVCAWDDLSFQLSHSLKEMREIFKRAGDISYGAVHRTEG